MTTVKYLFSAGFFDEGTSYQMKVIKVMMMMMMMMMIYGDDD